MSHFVTPFLKQRLYTGPPITPLFKRQRTYVLPATKLELFDNVADLFESVQVIVWSPYRMGNHLSVCVCVGGGGGGGGGGGSVLTRNLSKGGQDYSTKIM